MHSVGYNSVAVFISWAAVASQICKIPYEILQKFKLIAVQGSLIGSHICGFRATPRLMDWSWCHSKPHICDFLLVISSNFGCIVSLTIFGILTHLARKIAWFPHPILFDGPYRRNDISVMYTTFRSTFNRLQLCCWQYRFIFIRLATVGSQIWIKPTTRKLEVWGYHTVKIS